MKILTENIIGFEVADNSGKYLQGVNPTNGELLTEKFSIATVDDVNAAMAAADGAFKIFKKPHIFHIN